MPSLCRQAIKSVFAMTCAWQKHGDPRAFPQKCREIRPAGRSPVEEKRSFSDRHLTIRRFCIKIYYYRRDDGAGVRPAAAGQRRTPLAGSVRAERPEDSAGAGAATSAACPDAETRGKRKRQRRFEFGWHHEAMRLSSQNREDGRFFNALGECFTRSFRA